MKRWRPNLNGDGQFFKIIIWTTNVGNYIKEVQAPSFKLIAIGVKEFCISIAFKPTIPPSLDLGVKFVWITMDIQTSFYP